MGAEHARYVKELESNYYIHIKQKQTKPSKFANFAVIKNINKLMVSGTTRGHLSFFKWSVEHKFIMRKQRHPYKIEVPFVPKTDKQSPRGMDKLSRVSFCGA